MLRGCTCHFGNLLLLVRSARLKALSSWKALRQNIDSYLSITTAVSSVIIVFPPTLFFFFVFFFCIFPESSIKSFFFYISAMFITQQMLSLPLLCLFFSLSLLSFSVITPVVILLPVKTCF